MQALQNGDIVINNYNKSEEKIVLSGIDFNGYVDAFDNLELEKTSNSISINMKPRSRIWLKKGK